MRSLSLILASFALAHGHLSASTLEAEKFLKKAVTEVAQIADHSQNSSALAASVRPVLMNVISFELMTRRAVGPGWREFTEAQKKEATDLFATLIIRTYSSKFTPGEFPEISYKPAIVPAPGRVEIPTRILYRGSQYEVIYRQEDSVAWRITDVVIEGVSLIATYRTQFDSQFKQGGAPAVISALKKSVATPQ
jgi:phospholipid transport system substrate-binding protein